MIVINYHASKSIAAQMKTYKRICERCLTPYFLKVKLQHFLFFFKTLIHNISRSIAAKDDRSSRIQRRYSTKQQKSVGTGVEDSEDLSSSSVMMSSSASDHDPASEHNDELETSSETNSDESGSSRSTKPESDSSEAQYYRALLTEDSVKTHEFYFPPMSTYDRISYWKLADECSEIEDDFDDATYSSKPIRSERVSSNFIFVFLVQFLMIKSPSATKANV